MCAREPSKLRDVRRNAKATGTAPALIGAADSVLGFGFGARFLTAGFMAVGSRDACRAPFGGFVILLESNSYGYIAHVKTRVKTETT